MDKIEAIGAAIHQENMAKRREEWAKERATVMDDDLVKRLRMACKPNCKCSIQEAADAIERLSAENAALKLRVAEVPKIVKELEELQASLDRYGENANTCGKAAAAIRDYITTMTAAAEEIATHWEAHCDKEGYGPANLMNRLERSIAAHYHGYTSGEFQRLRARIAELESTLRQRQQLKGDPEFQKELRAAGFTWRECSQCGGYWSSGGPLVKCSKAKEDCRLVQADKMSPFAQVTASAQENSRE